MADEIREEKQEKWTGYREGMKGLWFGLGSVAAGVIPVAGLILGKIAMDHGEKCRKISPHTKRSLGLCGILLGGLGFFINLLAIASVITVIYLQASNIMELGAM